MNKMHHWLPALCVLLLAFGKTGAQQAGSNLFNPPDERLLVEAKWRYTYTLHAESNTIIHKADAGYHYFLYFRYDYTYQEYLNGKFSYGKWSLGGRTLHYPFQHVGQFEVVQLNRSVMVLEFPPKNGKGKYQYHFVRVESKDAPFMKPSNELPEVIVEADLPGGGKGGGKGALGKKKKRKDWLAWFRPGRKLPQPEAAPQEYISVELIGGGYYGGIDPVLKDFIRINTDGRLVKEFQSMNNGLLITKKNIPRTELEMFAEYVLKQGFFDFERTYDCTDPRCVHRKSDKPTPIPLRIVVTYGQRKKVVTVAIWGKDNTGAQYVEYPPQLDHIVDAIQRMANRLEEPVVRK